MVLAVLAITIPLVYLVPRLGWTPVAVLIATVVLYARQPPPDGRPAPREPVAPPSSKITASGILRFLVAATIVAAFAFSPLLLLLLGSGSEAEVWGSMLVLVLAFPLMGTIGFGVAWMYLRHTRDPNDQDRHFHG
jgi:hypothetical protein